ncbi:hypothetical protein NCCP1664_29390 [Zafaria cholistanensis]|uniref:Uncharacterized protein n=1 Tax=Zafaria cholistanensis TaxID=1682741 RepID=A0A5A7NU92_9MICC|nr:hypothetical protein NCCP1664_29390 [Zafaria cholistanensis]
MVPSMFPARSAASLPDLSAAVVTASERTVVQRGIVHPVRRGFHCAVSVSSSLPSKVFSALRMVPAPSQVADEAGWRAQRCVTAKAVQGSNYSVIVGPAAGDEGGTAPWGGPTFWV